VIILDTNVVSELTRATPDPGVRAWVNSRPSAQIGTTAITAAELNYGVARLPAGQRRLELGLFVRSDEGDCCVDAQHRQRRLGVVVERVWLLAEKVECARASVVGVELE